MDNSRVNPRPYVSAGNWSGLSNTRVVNEKVFALRDPASESDVLFKSDGAVFTKSYGAPYAEARHDPMALVPLSRYVGSSGSVLLPVVCTPPPPTPCQCSSRYQKQL